MSLISNKTIEENRVELEVAVEKEAFSDAMAKSYSKNIKKINVPGFRKGKAPKSIVEKMYGKGVFYEDAVEATYPAAYEAAVSEAGIDPVDMPEIEILGEIEDDGYKFSAKVYVKPQISIDGYKGIKAEKKVLPVTEADIDAEIERMRDRNSRMIDATDEAVKSGDTVVFDFEGFVDGEAFDGGKAEKFSLVIGSNQFIPGFEDQIIGHKIGEEFDVDITFPQEYHVDTLKGKPAVFKCKIHEIKIKELPELDDEFAKDISEFDTLSQLRDDEKKKLEDSREKSASESLENDLVDEVIKKLEGNIPQCMFDRAVDQMIRDFGYRLESQGLELKTYLQYTGMDNDAFRATFTEQAEKQVKIRLALEKIAEIENIKPTDEELEAEYEKIAKNYDMEVDKIKPMLPAEDIGKDICMNKAIDLIRDSAKIKTITE